MNYVTLCFKDDMSMVMGKVDRGLRQFEKVRNFYWFINI